MVLMIVDAFRVLNLKHGGLIASGQALHFLDREETILRRFPETDAKFGAKLFRKMKTSYLDI